jgi:magnesium-transporting ATPase (P-type)
MSGDGSSTESSVDFVQIDLTAENQTTISGTQSLGSPLDVVTTTRKSLHKVPSAQEILEVEPSIDISHACSVELVAKFLEANLETGLTKAEAESRLKRYGMNKLAESPPVTFMRRLWNQINQILIWILLVASLVSGALQSWPEFGLILAVVVINITIGLLQEGKANKATAALKSMLSSKATVIRDGQREEIDAHLVVPGDLIFVESGNKIPADIRMFQVSNLAVLESILTGEALPVNKEIKPLPVHIGVGDRKNICYSATSVIKGQGTGICVATGDSTEFGRIAQLVSGVEETKTNLVKQIDAFGRWIGLVVLPISLATFLIALLTPVELSSTHAIDGDMNLTGNSSSIASKAQQAFVISVAIAVSMIPAGLPASKFTFHI